MTIVVGPDVIRDAASTWLRENEGKARRLIEAKPDMTIAELQAATGWSDWDVNNMLTYLGTLEDVP